MKVSREDVRAVVAEVLAEVPELAGLGQGGATEVLGAVTSATAEGFAELERAILERGSAGREEVGVFMGMGASAEICGQFPEGDLRRRLFEAGRAVGRLIAGKWAEKIAEKLSSGPGEN